MAGRATTVDGRRCIPTCWSKAPQRKPTLRCSSPSLRRDARAGTPVDKRGVLSIFAGLAILIASLGLLGMIIYNLEQRTKEIGIRKVVGASTLNIWALMIKNYLYLMLAAFALSVPFCVWLLNKWLSNFYHRIDITAWPFMVAMGSILITALVITSYHVAKAAQMNPVNVLKDE